MSEVDFTNSLREEFAERGLVDPMEREIEEPTPLEIDEATPEDTDVEFEDDVVHPSTDRPRNPDGTFARREESESEDDRFGGDYGKLYQSYQELEQKLGTQGNEIGTRYADEIRQLRQELASFQAPAQPQQQVQSLEMFDQQVVDDPQGAAVWALQSNNPQLYERATDYWYGVDPKAATRFERSLENEQIRAQIRAEMGPVVVPMVQQATNARFDQAWSSVANRYTELRDEAIGDRMLEIATADPRLLRGLQSADPRETELVIENLLLRVLRQGGPSQQATSSVAAEQAASNHARKLGAMVTSGSSSHASAEGKTVVDRFKDRIVEASNRL